MADPEAGICLATKIIDLKTINLQFDAEEVSLHYRRSDIRRLASLIAVRLIFRDFQRRTTKVNFKERIVLIQMKV